MRLARTLPSGRTSPRTSTRSPILRADLRAARPDIPEPLLRVLRRGAARDPADRYASAQEYLEAFERSLRQGRERPWRWVGRVLGSMGWRRHRTTLRRPGPPPTFRAGGARGRGLVEST